VQIIKDFGRLIKFRVNVVVVFSSIIGYLIAANGNNIQLSEIIGLMFGGFFTTGAAHAINQLYEKDFDAVMDRTKDRPLPAKRMSVNQVRLYALIMTIMGALSFALLNNTLTLIIGLSSLLIYSYIYTPLKRKSPIAVVIGAIPGALPPTIGYIAFTGYIDNIAIFLFLFQFLWQFPHFWSIAWIWNDEYSKAGYDLLPAKKGRTIKNAYLTFISSLTLIPVLMLFYSNIHINIFYFLLIIMLTFWFNIKAYSFYKNPDVNYAKKLMLSSVIYLPLVQIIFVMAFWK